MVARKAFGMHRACCVYRPQWVQTLSHSGPHIFTAFHSCVSDYDIFCNHPPEKSSTLSKFLGFCLVSLALLDRNMAPLAKLQESLTHDHILSAFLGIYMAPTCTYPIMFIHLLPFCVSQFSIYLSQYFSRSFSFSMQWRGFCHVSRQTWPKNMASISCKTLRG